MNKTEKKQKQKEGKETKVVAPSEQKPKKTRDAVLRFTPYSWAKLIYLRDIGPTEIGGYGITPTDDPMLVTDFMLVKQECTSVTVELDEKDSIDFLERMMDCGLAPWQTQNIWLHTHPNEDPTPSQTDEENFDKNFSHPHWAIFFIIAEGGKTYCRIRHNVGPGIEVELDCEIDYSIGFPKSDFSAWKKEYDDNVTETQCFFGLGVHQLPHHYQGKGKLVSSLSSNDVEEEDLLANWEKENTDHIKSIIDFESELGEELEVDDMFIQDGQVHFWDEETEEYYIFDPKTDQFMSANALEDNKVIYYTPKVEPNWMRKVREFARKNLKPKEKCGH